MLTGRRAFTGGTCPTRSRRCCAGEPDWNALPSKVPLAVRALIHGCLRKDRKERIGDISTALFLLGQGRDPDALVTRPPRPCCLATRDAHRRGCADSAAIAATVVWQPGRRRRPGDSTRVHAAGGTPVDHRSRSRRHIAGRHTHGVRRRRPTVSPVHVGLRGQGDPRNRHGDRPGVFARWSIAGVLGRFGAQANCRQRRHGRADLPVGSTPSGHLLGATTTSCSRRQGTAIMRVSPSGGKPEVLLDLNNSDDAAFSPQLLPDGDTLLFTIGKRTSVGLDRWDDAQIVVQSLENGRAQDTHRGWKRCALRPDRPHRVRIGGNAVRGAVRSSDARSDRRSCARRRRRTTWTSRLAWPISRFPTRVRWSMCPARRRRASRTWCCSIARAARSRSSFRRESTTSRACLPMATDRV